jgi:hypothetical protein
MKRNRTNLKFDSIYIDPIYGGLVELACCVMDFMNHIL